MTVRPRLQETDHAINVEESDWNAQSILGTAAIFTDLGTAARAASVVCDGPALGRTEAGTHLGTSATSASQTYPQPAIRPVKANLSCNATRPVWSGAWLSLRVTTGVWGVDLQTYSPHLQK